MGEGIKRTKNTKKMQKVISSTRYNANNTDETGGVIVIVVVKFGDVNLAI